MSEGPDVWRMLLTDANEFHVPEEFREILRQAGVHVESVDGHEPTAIAAAGERCHGLFLYRARVDDALLAALPACRLLARVGTGYDAIDVEAARRRGVMVTYVPDFCTEELSDHVMACILGFTRQFPFILSRARDHRWLTIAEVPVQRRLRGRTLGILGFGRSGQRTAEKARAFGMDARAWTRTPRPADLARAGARAATFEEALECAFVSLHLPLTEATRGLIGREALARMRPDAVLVNIARGAIVDTDALVDALRAGRLAGAALDVVQPAPLPPEHPLWSIPNVWITSHTGTISAEAADDAWSTVVEDVIRVRNGLPPAHAVPELQGEGIATIEPGVLPPPGI